VWYNLKNIFSWRYFDMLSDIEIAQGAKMLPIKEVAASVSAAVPLAKRLNFSR
jgi:hypothetical protein